jgi:hypothetical protein
MKLSTAFVLLGAASQATAFAPQPMGSAARVSTELEMANGAKRAAARKVLKKVGKVAGAAAAVTLATSAGAPSSVVAAKKAAEVVEAVDSSAALVTAGAFAAGLVSKPLVDSLAGLTGGPTADMVDSIDKNFPGAQKNTQLVKNIKSALDKYGYGKTSLVATSLCADEVNRPLEQDLGDAFDDNFSMGGLAGEFFLFVWLVGNDIFIYIWRFSMCP